MRPFHLRRRQRRRADDQVDNLLFFALKKWPQGWPREGVVLLDVQKVANGRGQADGLHESLHGAAFLAAGKMNDKRNSANFTIERQILIDFFADVGFADVAVLS